MQRSTMNFKVPNVGSGHSGAWLTVEGACMSIVCCNLLGIFGHFQCEPMATNKGGYEENGRFSMCECCGEAAAV